MLFVLGGPSYVGKKTSIAHFMKLYSFSSIIPYTTKPVERRIRETEGIQYHYIPDEERDDIENNNFIYDTPFDCNEYSDKTLYAYRKTDIENAIDSYSNFIIHASVGNIKKIYDSFHNVERYRKNLYLFFLNFETNLSEEFFEKKQPQEQKIDKNSDTFKRRYGHAKKEIAFYRENKNIFDGCVRADHEYKICEKLEEIILPKLMVMPTSPDKIPGPLSDVDIVYMCEKRKNDPFEVSVDGEPLSVEAIKKLLCGCGMHLSLSNMIRQIKSEKLGTFIDMALDESELRDVLLKTYPEKSIEKGYILKPNETILCSSMQEVKIPHDVYGIVASKFSYTQLGLSIELGTSIIQNGHNGKIHFQIKNNTNNYICIYPGIEVAQISFQRTVQPGSDIYRKQKNSQHAYDMAVSPPISKFREKNSVLGRVKRPNAGFWKKVSIKLEEKLATALFGTIICVLLAVINWNRIIMFVEAYIFPFAQNLYPALLVGLFAVTCCILNSFCYIAGMTTLFILRKIRQIYFAIRRQSSTHDWENTQQ